MPNRPPTLGSGRVLGRAGYDAERRKVKASRRWYGTVRWKRRRAAQLAREPLCWMCLAEGRTVAATVADHREPHREDPDKFWHGELGSLCASHHSSAKQREETGGGSKV